MGVSLPHGGDAIPTGFQSAGRSVGVAAVKRIRSREIEAHDERLERGAQLS